MSLNYDTLVLSGGGVHGVSILGALHYIYENRLNMLEGIKYYSGTSVGAYICYLLIIGLTPMEIFTYVCSKVNNISLTNLTIYNLINKHGCIPNEFINHIVFLTLEKTGKENLTFKQLYDTYNKELVVCAFNVTVKEPRYFSYRLTPDMSCIDALRLTSAIPLVFTKQYYKGELYIDGAVTNCFPIQQVYTPHTTNTRKKYRHILGVNMGITPHIDDGSILNYIVSVLDVVNEQCQSTVIPPHSTVITIQRGHTSGSMDFNSTTTDKIKLFQIGQKHATERLRVKSD
jgi:predicted acylesterase/phospholipase RssA